MSFTNQRSAFILFGILAALVIICSLFLREGFDTDTTNMECESTNKMYTGPNGQSLSLTKNCDGSQTITLADNSVTFESSSANVFIGPNGNKATFITTNNGTEAIKVETQMGTVVYTINPDNTQNNTIIVPNSNTAPEPVPDANPNDYSNSLPPGIPANQIPPGHEDLYILKSQVVPPVCPVCPARCEGSTKSKCPPCKPCGRCPEPSMTCKAVPNYNAIGGGNGSLNSMSDYVPLLSDFSNF